MATKAKSVNACAAAVRYGRWSGVMACQWGMLGGTSEGGWYICGG